MLRRRTPMTAPNPCRTEGRLPTREHHWMNRQGEAAASGHRSQAAVYSYSIETATLSHRPPEASEMREKHRRLSWKVTLNE